MGFDIYYLSENGCRYALQPKRIKKKFTYINPDISGTITAQGENNFTGTFVSALVKECYESNGETIIVLENGGAIVFDGENIERR